MCLCRVLFTCKRRLKSLCEAQQYMLIESVCAKVSGDLFLVILSIVSPVSVVEAVHDSLKCIMVSESSLKDPS